MDAVAQLTAALAGRYAIDREIGRRGMATVFLAVDVRHHRKVAIKVLHPELSAVIDNPTSAPRIRRTDAENRRL
jgi:serine/threonine-protein kinase